MVKNTTNLSSNLGIYAILAIVAIVAIFAIAGGQSVVSPANSVFSSNSNLLGDARLAISKDSGSLDTYSKTSSYEKSKEFEKPRELSEKELAVMLAEERELYDDEFMVEKESEEESFEEDSHENIIGKLGLSELEFIDFSIAKQPEKLISLLSETVKTLDIKDANVVIGSKASSSASSGFSGITNLTNSSDCVPINQSNITMNALNFFGGSGCYILTSDIDLGSATTAALGITGSATLYCDDHELTSAVISGSSTMFSAYHTLDLFSSAIAHDCVVRDSPFAFGLFDHSKIYDSSAISTPGVNWPQNIYGFSSTGWSEVHNGFADGKLTGFSAFSSSKVFDSSASNNYFGFNSLNNAIISDSSSVSSAFGFYLQSNSIVVNSVAESNTDGFHLQSNSNVIASLAEFNLVDGFRLADNSVIDSSKAISNGQNGFHFMYNSVASSVYDSIAESNSKNGFHSEAGANLIDDSIAKTNGWNGFYLEDNSQTINSHSEGNAGNGFVVRDSSSVTDSVAMYNHRNGFLSKGSSNIYPSKAIENEGYGFVVRDTSKVLGSLAEQNHRSGFVLFNAAVVEKVRSISNDFHGIVVRTTSAVPGGNVRYADTLHNQQNGVLVVSSSNLLSPDGRSCSNGQEDLFTQCSPSTGICGGFTANQYTAGSMNFPPSPAIGTLTPC